MVFRWAGVTPRGKSLAIVQHMKESPLFNPDFSLRDTKTAVTVGLGRYFEYSRRDIWKCYRQAYSREELDFDSWKGGKVGGVIAFGLGMRQFKYQLNIDAVAIDISETEKRAYLSEKFAAFTWHDLLFLIFVKSELRQTPFEERANRLLGAI